MVISMGRRKQHKHLVLELRPGAQLQLHVGVLPHEALLDAGPGGVVHTKKGHMFLVSRPTLEDLVLEQPRDTTPSYPKDVAASLMMLGIRHGDTVMEAGSGSGGMTCHLSQAVGAAGTVHSLDVVGERHSLW